MSTHQHIDRICVAAIVLSLLLTVLFMNGKSLGLETVVDEDGENHSDSVYFTANDQNGDWDTSDATVITLDGDSGTVKGNGAYFYDGDLVISGGGYYVISGTLTDGSIIVDAYSSSKVYLRLNGVSITCSDDACIRVDKADKVFLTLAGGTENTLESGTEYSETALADGTDGVIFAHDDLTINGSGSLTVTGGWKHGIAANDDLVIAGGIINVTAAADAIHANDSLRIMAATITVTAGDDGIAVSNEGGYLYIASGTVTVTAEDDGIHTAGDIIVDGGSLTVSAGDDGIHSDTAFAINGGAVLISQCYEGIEAVTIVISGGEITIYPTDDGLNANGGSSVGFGFGGMGGPGGMAASDASDGTEEDSEDEETYIRISGGTLTVINETGRDADGLDSNGSIYITGGTVLVSVTGSTGSNSAIDYGSESGGVCEITGGTVIACGGSSMAERFDSSSSQCSIFYNLTDAVSDGAEVTLQSEDGTVLLNWTVPCAFTSINISCPELTVGETYILTVGDNTETVKQEQSVTTLGSVQTGMFAGMGGMQPMGGGRDNTSDSETTDTDQPDFSEMGTPPDGEQTDTSQMRTPPNGLSGGHGGRGFGSHGQSEDSASDSERPQWDGGFSQQSEQQVAEEASETDAAETAVDWTDGTVWLLVGISALALLAGILIAVIVKH